MNAEFTTVSAYFECKSKLIGKIATYDLLIESMEKTLMAGIESGHLLQWELDDGQMKVRSQYRNVNDLSNAMQGLIKLRQYYINKANGRSIRLVGGNL
jgi:hypothetical protein